MHVVSTNDVIELKFKRNSTQNTWCDSMCSSKNHQNRNCGREVQEQEPRQPRVSSMWLEHTTHLLYLLPLQMGTKSLWQDATPRKRMRFPLAFVLPDPTFLGVEITTILQSWSAQLHNNGIDFFQFRWLMQKNLKNGECISQVRNADPTLFTLIASLQTW